MPDDQQEALRTLVRYRHTLEQDCSGFKNRMQKSLEVMNIKFHTLFADVSGKTSTAFIEAILAGERDPKKFLHLVDKRIKASANEIVKSLERNWRTEYLFTLRQSFEMNKIYEDRIKDCDKAIEESLQCYEALTNNGEYKDEVKKNESKKRKHRSSPTFDVRSYLEKIYKVDVLSIYGLSEMSGLEKLAETGADLSKWPTIGPF